MSSPKSERLTRGKEEEPHNTNSPRSVETPLAHSKLSNTVRELREVTKQLKIFETFFLNNTRSGNTTPDLPAIRLLTARKLNLAWKQVQERLLAKAKKVQQMFNEVWRTQLKNNRLIGNWENIAVSHLTISTTQRFARLFPQEFLFFENGQISQLQSEWLTRNSLWRRYDSSSSWTRPGFSFQCRSYKTTNRKTTPLCWPGRVRQSGSSGQKIAWESRHSRVQSEQSFDGRNSRATSYGELRSALTRASKLQGDLRIWVLQND